MVARPALANAELAIMDLLWDGGPLTARQIREQLYPDAARPQHGTVQRLLQRLEDKGYVVRAAGPTGQRFSATLSREAYAGSQLETLAERLTAGSLAPLVTHFVEQRRLTAEEIERLRRILDEAPAGDEEPA